MPVTDIDTTSAFVIVVVAAASGVLTMLVAPRMVIPVVVIELQLGIIVGPEVLDFAKNDAGTQFLGNLGLGMLFFFAGYEIDFGAIKGQPLKLAATGWAISLAIAYTIGGVLALIGIVVSLLYTGSAIATTAIGTLIPILKDAGEMKTKFGSFLLSAGAMGEFGPILLITLVLSSGKPIHEAAVLIAFVILAVLAGLVAVRGAGKSWPALERTIETSGQVAVRLAVVLVFGLVALATELGLDLLLGGFVAGLITRAALRGREIGVFESKLTALGYGLLIPFFFITSGMQFDLDSLLESPASMAELPLFLALFLLVRGLPAMLLYRRVLDLRDRSALAIFSATELPLVVAITTLAVDGGHMQSATAASLVGAAIISALVFPLIGLKLRRDATRRPLLNHSPA